MHSKQTMVAVRRFACSLAVFGGLLVAGVQMAHAGDDETGASSAFAMTVSGGISLGTYQGGVVWSVLAAARATAASGGEKHELKTFTGASAGNINAVLGAVEWCRESFEFDPEKSLFWQVWTRTGIEQLFQRYGSVNLAYEELEAGRVDLPNMGVNDAAFPGLFHRTYFDDNRRLRDSDKYKRRDGVPYDDTHFTVVERAMRDERARPGCEVSVAVTTSSVPAKEHLVPNTEIKIAAHRFAILTRAVAGEDGRVRFQPARPSARLSSSALSSIRKKMGLHGTLRMSGPGIEVPLRDVLNAAAASSAFPFAFSPQRVDLCEYKGTEASLEGCATRVLDADEKVFVDGGVFDNKPLPLAIDIGELTGIKHERYVYVDQDRRDPEPARTAAIPGAEQFGLTGVLQLVGGAVSSARQYELFAAGRYQLAGEERVLLTRRFPHVAAGHLQAFGGFLGTPLRQYDFYAGIYDGLTFFARDMLCAPVKETSDACVGRSLKTLISALSLDALSPEGYLVVWTLCKSRLDQHCTLSSPGGAGATQAPELIRYELLKAVLTAAEEMRDAANKQENLVEGGSDSQPFETLCGPVAPGRGRIIANRAFRATYEAAVADGFVCLLSRVRTHFEKSAAVIQWYRDALDEPHADSAPWASASKCFVGIRFDEGETLDCNRSERQRERRSGLVYQNSVFVDAFFTDLMSDPKSALVEFQRHVLLQAWAMEDRLKGKVSDAKPAEKSLLDPEGVVDLASMLSALSDRGAGPSTYGITAFNRTPDYAPPRAVPAWCLARYLPISYISANVVDGGVEVGYQPGWLADSERWIVHANLLPVLYDDNTTEAAWGVGAGVRRNLEQALLSGFGMTVSHLSEYGAADENAISYEGSIYLLMDSMRIGLRITDDLDDEWNGSEDWALTIGINDPGGLAYWLIRLWD